MPKDDPRTIELTAATEHLRQTMTILMDRGEDEAYIATDQALRCTIRAIVGGDDQLFRDMYEGLVSLVSTDWKDIDHKTEGEAS